MSTNNSEVKTMYENQNKQTEIVDPYASINANEGAPFIIRRNYYADVLSVFFNQSWNAAFVIELLQPEYDSRTRMYRIPGISGIEVVGEDRMCSIMADELAEYWREFHPDAVKDLLPRLTNSVLHASVKMMRGRIRRD
jgi:hypothetical protein